MKKHGDKALGKVLRFAVNGAITLFAATAAAIAVMLICGIRLYVVRTGSMEPEIKTGSLCFVDHRAELSSIKCGDIITFSTSDGTAVTHRAVRTENGSIITKGDANNAEDENAVTSDNFIGKCIFNIPQLGKAVQFLRSPWGIAASVSMIVLLISADQLIDKKKLSE